MTRRRWGIVATVALVAGVAAVRLLTGSAQADTTKPGGGWAHAGVLPGQAQAPTRNARAAGVKAAGAKAAAARPASVPGYAVDGIDVSSHDHDYHDINWAAVAAGGVKFAYVKAAEGNDYTNPYFAADYQAARNNGIYAGAYDFGRPDLGDPVGQADFFVTNMLWTGDNLNLVPFLDMEWNYIDPKQPCWNQTPAQLTAWIHGFLAEVQRHIGRPPMIYTAASWWNTCTGNDATFGSYPLDLANYNTSAPPTPMPAGWSTYALWQYAGGNNQQGLFDSDVYNGDLPGLATLAGSTPPTVISLLSHADGRFVTAESAGSQPLIANRTAVGPWEQFDEVPAGGGYVALRSHANGRYVTAEAAGTSSLIANRMAIGAWEKFKIVMNGAGNSSLIANADLRFVTAEYAGGRPLIANRDAVGQWEEFDAVTPPTVVSLRARSNGAYVSADKAGTVPLIANRSAVGTWEQFDRIDLPGGYIALRAHANGQWVSADRGGAGPLIADRLLPGPWEQFKVINNGDGSVSLLAQADGRYVSGNNGGASLIADRAAIGDWEKFDLG